MFETVMLLATATEQPIALIARILNNASDFYPAKKSSPSFSKEGIAEKSTDSFSSTFIP